MTRAGIVSQESSARTNHGHADAAFVQVDNLKKMMLMKLMMYFFR